MSNVTVTAPSAADIARCERMAKPRKPRNIRRENGFLVYEEGPKADPLSFLFDGSIWCEFGSPYAESLLSR